MIIKGYLTTSAIEWPGKISAVIFTGGCNFRCSYCHNADLTDSKKLNRLTRISEEKIFTDIVKRKKWLDAVVITGGEPTLQADLEELIKKVKDLGLEVMIETNGSRPEVIARLLDCYIVDRFAIDVKGLLDNAYRKIVKLPGFKIADLKKTLQLVAKSGIDFELRTTVVPGIHDQKTIKKIAQQIKSLTINHQSLAIEWFLQTFLSNKCLDPEFEKIKPYSQKEMEKMLIIARKILPNTNLR